MKHMLNLKNLNFIFAASINGEIAQLVRASDS